MAFITGCEIFITSTPANFGDNAPARRNSQTSNAERQQETAKGGGASFA